MTLESGMNSGKARKQLLEVLEAAAEKPFDPDSEIVTIVLENSANPARIARLVVQSTSDELILYPKAARE